MLGPSQTERDYFGMQSHWQVVLCENVYFVVFMLQAHFASHGHIKSKSEPVQHPLLSTRAVIKTNETKTRIELGVKNESKRGCPGGLGVKGAFHSFNLGINGTLVSQFWSGSLVHTDFLQKSCEHVVIQTNR